MKLSLLIHNFNHPSALENTINVSVVCSIVDHSGEFVIIKSFNLKFIFMLTFKIQQKDQTKTGVFISRPDQSPYMYRSRAGRHFMEQKMRFGLVLGWLAVLKKNWANYEQMSRAVFSCFQEQKKIRRIFKNIVASALKSCIISLL